MAKSIMQSTKECYLCRKWYNLRTLNGLELHHIFPGTADRKISDRLGLTVWLCHSHHNQPPLGAHFNIETREALEEDARRVYDAQHGAGALDAELKTYWGDGHAV